jgi:O-Antigen ligase
MMSSFFQDKQLSFSSWMLLLLSGILLFIFSLPHAIALRKLLLLLAFLISFKSFWDALRKKPKPLLLVVLLFAILQVWMLVIAGFISDQPSSSFSEWKGQWLPVFMSFVVGIGLARALMQSKLKNPRVAVAMTILIPITLFLCVNAFVIIHDLILAGTFLSTQLGITDQHGVTNYLIALIEPILIADMLSRLVKGNRLLPVPGWVISAIIILALFSLFAASSRNGIIIMLLAFVLGAAMMISEVRKVYSPQKIITSVLATLIFVLAIAFVSYKIDPRWQNFIETVPIAWDIDRDLLWLNGDGTNFPLTPSGKQVDISEYSRIAWAHEGWRMLMAHPWGMEIARDTFHKLELAKYGYAGMAHSHNSWIDFGLEVGIPGLLLWGWILLLLAQFGWRTWRTHKEPLGLALAVLVIMFAVRGLLDSIFRDHEIEQFMLVASLLFSILSFGKTNIPKARL